MKLPNSYVHVGICRISPNHSYIAYTLDVTGGERFLLQVKDLQSGFVIPKFRDEGVVSLAWAQDSSTLFYTISDQNQRPYRLKCTRIGLDSMDSTPLFTENDSRYCLDITSTKDGKFVTVNSNSRTSSEVYVINATDPETELRRFCKRASGVQYFLEHHDGFFYVLTNDPLDEDKVIPGSENYRLARCRVEDLGSSKLQSIIRPGEGTCLQDMDIFHEHLVLFLNKEGSSTICSIKLPINGDCEKRTNIYDFNPWFFPMPSDMCTISPTSNHDFTSSVYRVVLSSPVMPDVFVDYDMSRNLFKVVQQEELPNICNSAEACSLNRERLTNGLDLTSESKRDFEGNNVRGWKGFSETYYCEKSEVISYDGERIPLTILYSRKAYQKGESCGLLHGYGAYGEVLDKSWCSDRLSLLDRGWVIAFADVRGGDGPDPSWHSSGSGLNKLNSIHDFVSCGNYLVNEGYVHKGKLCATGNSAGCLLVGAAINMHPELFKAAILKVPFLDACSTLLDANLPLTILDYEEFGNPQIKSEFDYILKYSPYDNISPGHCYPAMLITPSFNDTRVGVWEAAKWVAKVRDITCSICSSSIIMRTNMTGGHFGEGGRFGQCEVTSYEYAFLMKVLGTLK